MNPFSWLDKMVAVARRDLLTAIRYRTAFLTLVGAAIAELAAFYYLSQAIGPAFRPQGFDYFPFLMVGTGFYAFLVKGVNAFLTTVADAQQTGTLEVLMTTATPPTLLIFVSAVSAFAGSLLELVLYLVTGLIVFGAPIHPNWLGCAVIFMLSLGMAVAIGIAAAAVQLAVQKGSAVLWLLGSVTWLLTGTLFPVSSLPKALRNLSALIPITHSLDGMRLALLQGVPFPSLAREIVILALFCLFLLPFSLLIFSYTLHRARVEGSLSFY